MFECHQRSVIDEGDGDRECFPPPLGVVHVIWDPLRQRGRVQVPFTILPVKLIEIGATV